VYQKGERERETEMIHSIETLQATDYKEYTQKKPKCLQNYELQPSLNSEKSRIKLARAIESTLIFQNVFTNFSDTHYCATGGVL